MNEQEPTVIDYVVTMFLFLSIITAFFFIGGALVEGFWW